MDTIKLLTLQTGCNTAPGINCVRLNNKHLVSNNDRKQALAGVTTSFLEVANSCVNFVNSFTYLQNIPFMTLGSQDLAPLNLTIGPKVTKASQVTVTTQVYHMYLVKPEEAQVLDNCPGSDFLSCCNLSSHLETDLDNFKWICEHNLASSCLEHQIKCVNKF